MKVNTSQLFEYRTIHARARLEVLFDSANFWNLKSERHTSGPDGTRIYMEDCKNGTYHSVQRESEDSSLASIVEIFDIVGKLEWLEN